MEQPVQLRIGGVPRRVLKHHFPKTKQYGDIKELDATDYTGRVDILTGGFPANPTRCRQRKGKEDDRHLWPEICALYAVFTRWVVGENVRGLVGWNGGMVFEEVCLTWKLKGTPYNRSYFQIAVSVLPTDR